MRVISGTARGLKLVSPEGSDTRPTLDRVKEALFSMLTPYITDAAVLDLFAGSGALGIEALSRGARKAVFVDCSAKAASAVKANLEKSRLSQRAVFVASDAFGYLRGCREIFGLILLDPPYGDRLYEPVLKLISEKKLLNEDGVIAVEWDAELGEPSFPPELERIKDRKYGRVHITLLRRRRL